MTAATCAIDEVSLCGAATDTYEYDAFGNLLNKTGSTPNNYLYRGEQYDSDLGLYYLRARYYNPLTGRFMSRDPKDPSLFDSDGNPVDPKSLHKYLYAEGDPVNAIDPTGQESLAEFAKATFISSVETILWATKTAARVRCLVTVSITLLNAATNHTNWRWPLTWAGILNSIWSCKAAFTPL